MSKLTSLFRRAPKRFSAVVAMVAAAIVVPAAVLAWGPSRETFTIQNPSDHVQFNSITNNPNIGDERNFVGVREVGSSNVWHDDMTVQEGKEYYVRMYVHNNAASSLNLVAENVTAKVNLPTTTGKSIQVNGFVSASNVGADKNGNAGAYAEVYDHATFNSTTDFNLAYVSGSLKFENNHFGANGTTLPESIFTSTGAKLGYDQLNGKIPGCFEYAGYVSFKVKPQFAKTTNFTLKKLVSKHGANTWVENYEAQPGETVDFALTYKNTGQVQHNDVTFRDTLPTGLTYVQDSAKWNNASQKNMDAGNNLTTGVGVNVGSYAPGANAWVTFSAKVAAKEQLKCGDNSLVNKGKVNTGGYAVEDTASVTVKKECLPEVKYTCDALKVDQIDRTNFRFTTTYTAQNATFKSVTYTVRNASGAIVTTQTSTSNTLNYTQNTPGSYTVQAVVTFTVNGEDKTATSEACKGSFKVTELPKEIKVCDLKTKQIVTIKESDFDSTKYSKNLEDCKEVVKKIKVCELATKQIVVINEKDFDSSKYSKNLEDCKEKPPVKIEVCDLTTKKIVTINEADFDETKYSKDLSKCEETPVTPPELPQTGAGEGIVALVGLGALIASIGYYVASRRALNQ